MSVLSIKRPRNTKKRGIIEFLFYQEKNHYVGVCLTFNIVEEGKNLVVLRKSIEEAAKLHLRVVVKKNLSDDLLNRYAPAEYWRKYFNLQKSLARGENQNNQQKTIATSNTRYSGYTMDDFLSSGRQLVNS